MAKHIENVRPEIFRATIFHGLLLKDASIGDTFHGEYTHIIQWLLISWQQRDSNFLKVPAINIFKQLGEEKSVFYRSPITESEFQDPSFRRVEKSIWDLIVDQSKNDVNDFRCPEILTTFILETEDENLLILKSLIKKRIDKRMTDEDLEGFNKKYQDVMTIMGSDHEFILFKRKGKKIEYRGGNLEDVLEPKDILIDLDEFKKRST